MAAQFATRFAVIVFATVILRGAVAFDDFRITVSAALKLGAIFFGLGLVVGELARRAVEEIAEREFRELTTEAEPPAGRTATETAPSTQH